MRYATFALLVGVALLLAGIGVVIGQIYGELRTIEQRNYLDCQVMASDFFRCESVPVVTRVS